MNRSFTIPGLSLVQAIPRDSADKTDRDRRGAHRLSPAGRSGQSPTVHNPSSRTPHRSCSRRSERVHKGCRWTTA
jgi:hypothetical protein